MPNTKETPRKRSVCPNCKKEIKWEEYLAHMKKCGKSKVPQIKHLACSICQSTFSKRANLNKHVRKFHPVSATETSSATDIKEPKVIKSPETQTTTEETDWDKDPEIELDYNDSNSDRESMSSESEEESAGMQEAQEDLTLGRVHRKRTEPAKVLAPKRRNVSNEEVGASSKEMKELRVSVIDMQDMGIQTISHRCEPCGITFDDEIMSMLHRGWHSHVDFFVCNLCGENCENKYQFHSHMAKSHNK